MKYEDKVKEKIKESNIRTKERLEVWSKICKNYKKGGVEQVKSSISEIANAIRSDFDEIISILNEML